MKKYSLSVLFLCLIMASFRTAGAKECGGSAGDYTLNRGTLTFASDCTSVADYSFTFENIQSIDFSGTSITSIGNASFGDCKQLSSIKFPASLTSIEDDAFSGCENLTSVDLSGTSVTTLKRSAFINCTKLSSVKLPASLTSLGPHAFGYCPSLTSVDLSNTSVTSIEGWAFISDSSLSSVKLPASLTSLGEGTFENCNTITSIDLSNTSINAIEKDAFKGIGNPSTITVAKGSDAHKLLGVNGIDSVNGEPISSTYGDNWTTLNIAVSPTPTPNPLEPTPTPEPGNASGAADVIRVVPLPEDEFGSYELDPVTGEKNYLMFNTYAICMDFLNNEELCSGYERCYHK